MAADEATIKVTGLPRNIPENRLIDKLQIHFLRKKNGGGDIQYVSISKCSPGTAFISFQETEVAQRLAQRGTQVFKVNDKTYAISISLHQRNVDPDRVLLQVCVTVDHTKLPEGKETLVALLKTFPGVLLSHNHHREPCTLTGGYTDIWALSGRILESVEMQKQFSDDEATIRSASIENHGILQEKSSNPILANGGLRETKCSAVDLQTEKSQKSGPAQAINYNPEDVIVSKYNLNPARGTPNEDLSLVVDSDIFRYLQKHCSKDYQSILNQSKVEVLNVNCEDITILYLQPKGSQSEQSLVNTAHQYLTRLFQEKERQLRKEQVSKDGIAQKDLEDSLKLLRTKLPMLMIDEDEGNLYMVGSKSSVSEAKQLFVDIKGIRNKWSPSGQFASSQSTMDFKNEGAASVSQSEAFQPIRSQSDDLSNLFKLRDNVLKKSKEELYTRRRQSDVLKQVQDQTKETTTLEMFPISTAECVLNHQIKIKSKDRDGYKSSSFDSSKSSSSASISELDNKPADNPENFSEEQKSRKGHKAKADSLKERKMAANFSSKTVDSRSQDRKMEQNQPSDSTVPVGFASAQPPYLHFIKPSMRNLCPSGFSKTDVQTLKDDMKRLSQIPSNLFEKTQSGHHSKESQCYSLGYMNLSGDQSEIKRNQTMSLTRSNSFSGRINGSSQGVQNSIDRSVEMGSSLMTKVVTAELMVSSRLWLYLKSVYNTQIENLTSDLQLKETLGNKETVLKLMCADVGKVDECLQGLKSLISKVKVDFETKTIPLSLFGVDHKNKTLLDFCTVMKKRHESVKMTVISKYVMILGPKLTCENVEKTMMEVFHPGVHSLESKVPSGYPMMSYPETSAINQDLLEDLNLTGAGTLNKVHPSTDARSDIMDKATQEQKNQRYSKYKEESFMTTLFPGDCKTLKSESVRISEPTEVDSMIPKNKSTFKQVISHSAQEAQSAAHAGGNRDVLLCSVCKRMSNTVKQPCGLNVCSQCDKDVHKTCKTCSLHPIKDPMAIKGTMSVRESTITIPGFLRNTTLRIIYDIPDGIQGDGHPCPGAPYKGGRFEAYLPDNESTRKLLYFLEKAFYKGLTFMVKVGSTEKEEDRQEGTVVWGSIPHKTRTEGGASKNGYPDSSYIRRLTEALKAAGIQQ